MVMRFGKTYMTTAIAVNKQNGQIRNITKKREVCNSIFGEPQKAQMGPIELF